MKETEKLKIFRLEDRILFEAAAAAEVVDAVQNALDSNAAENNDKEVQDINLAVNVPFETGNAQTENIVVDPADIADVDAEINALIEGVIPQNSDIDVVESDSVSATLNDNGLTVSTGRELVVINDSVKDIDSILESLNPNQDAVILNRDNGLIELNEYLDGSDIEYSAIHFVTHGEAGKLNINGEVIDNDSFNAKEWQEVGEHLTADGDIYFYGCNVASNNDGQILIDRIADASEADVAASDDFTGRSGDWDLEYVVGEADTKYLCVTDYSRNLADITVQVYNFDDLKIELNNAANNSFSEYNSVTIEIIQDITIQETISLDFVADLDLDLTICGKEGAGITITGLDGYNIFYFTEVDDSVSIDITIDNLIFVDNGDGIESAIDAVDIDSLTISNSKFTGFDGGAVIYFSVNDGNFSVSDSEFINNSVDAGDGGAINANGINVSISGSYFSGNKASGNGGAVEIEAANSAKITNSSFDNNISEYGGGAVGVTVVDGEFSVSNSTFYNNQAEVEGGAISIQYYGSGTASITNSTFTANSAVDTNGWGDAIYNGDGDLTIDNTLLVSNGTSDIWQDSAGGSTTVTNSMITAIDSASGTVSATDQVNAEYTADKIFNIKTNLDALYEAGNHTLELNPFHKAAWSGSDAAVGEKDQLGNDRNAINEELGISGMYSIGAVTAKAAIIVTQGDYSVTYTGSEIIPENRVSVTYADGTTQINNNNISTSVSASTTIKNVGDYTITPDIDLTGSGIDIAADNIRYVAGTLTVKPYQLTITVTGTKVYDGTADMGSSTFTYELSDPSMDFDTSWLTVTDFTYNSKNVEGLQTLTSGCSVSTSAAASNYIVNFIYKGEITKATLTVSVGTTAISKKYDGTTDVESSDIANNYIITGWATGDNGSVTSANWAYDNKDASSTVGVTVNNIQLDAETAKNYDWNTSFTTTGEITKRSVVISSGNGSWVYDGTAHSQEGVTVSGDGFVTGEGGTASNYATVTNVSDSGTNNNTFDFALNSETLASNYDISYVYGDLTITKATLTVSVGTTAISKKYDGTTDVESFDIANNYVITGWATGDNGSVTSANWAYDNKDASSTVGVTVNNIQLDAETAKNYDWNTSFTTTGEITKRSVVISSGNGSWVYDGTAHSQEGVTVSGDGFVTGEGGTASNYATVTNVSDSGTNNNTFDFTLNSETLASNYDISYVYGDLTITAKSVDVTFVTDEPYHYNGTDQSGTVSATYTDINGNIVNANINWHGETFKIPGTYTVTAESTDSNYVISATTANKTLVMNNELPTYVVYSEAFYPGFSSNIASMIGDIVAHNSGYNNGIGNLSMLNWDDFVNITMLDYLRNDDGIELSNIKTVSSVDSLKYRPMEKDSIASDVSDFVMNGNISKQQSLYLGKEICIEASLDHFDTIELFENRADSYSEEHNPIVIEADYEFENRENQIYCMTDAVLNIPAAALRKAKADNLADVPAEYNMPFAVIGETSKVSNFKSDIERILDKMLS